MQPVEKRTFAVPTGPYRCFSLSRGSTPKCSILMKKDALPLSSQLEHVLGEMVRFLSARASTQFTCQPPVAPVCRNAFASSCEGNLIGFVLFHSIASSSPPISKCVSSRL